VSGIVILTATDVEAAALARGLRLPRLASSPGRVYGGDGCRLGVVGPRAALLPERWSMLRADLARPLVVSAGVCGGLDPSLRRGDLVVPETVLGLLGERWDVARLYHSRALEALDAMGRRACSGRLVQAADVVATPADKAALLAATGALAVDMESATILRTAQAAGCPALVMRGVSDDAGETLPRALLAAVGADGRLRRGRAVAALAASPAAWLRVLGLRRATALALAAVAGAIQWLIEFSALLAED
jgi:adenosylhomocysteine nucleosidase